MDNGYTSPPDPESVNHGHEMTDVALKPIIIFLVVLVLFGGLLQGAMTLVMTGLAKEDAKIAVPESKILQDPEVYSKVPPLQKDTTGDMLRMYAQENAILDTYYTNPKTKAIRVPIDRAMRIVANKGLPSRPNPPKMDTSKELPYPAKSQPYMATP